ncbi:MAG: ABC transporter ATP-binding protein [Lachnospiraceae bacterium]
MRDKFKFHKKGFYLLKVLRGLDGGAIWVSVCSALLEAGIPYIGFVFSAMIIDNLLMGAWTAAVVHVVFLIGLSLLFGLLQNQLSKILAVKYQMLYTDFKILMRKKALSINFESFENPEVAGKIYRAERTIDMYGGLEEILYLYQQLLSSAISGITALGLVGYMCFAKGTMGRISVPITVLSFLVAVGLVMKATFFSSGYFLKQQNQIFSGHGDAEEGLSYYMDQIYGNEKANKTAHLYHMKDLLLGNFNGFLDVSSGLYKKMKTVRRRQELTGQGISAVFTVYSYALILLKIWSKAISIGSFTKYAGAMTSFMNDMTTLVWTNGEIARNCEFMQDFIDFMEMEDDSRGGVLPIRKEAGRAYEIEFHNVSFCYPGSENMTLRNINCKINGNNKTAIVGRNGAGKTTFIKLLCGLYHPTQGTISLDGIDIKEYDYQDYMGLFSVAFQDFTMFAFPVGQNIATSRVCDRDKIWNCLTKAGVEQVVKKMPQKLDTPMFSGNEGGVNVSGGEMQKLAIARALYKDAPLIILDEPTAALDPVSEYEIYKRFDELVKHKTSIFITHRMSSCRFCDDILVFENGEIVERGNHEKLLQNRVLYSELWNAQAQHYGK